MKGNRAYSYKKHILRYDLEYKMWIILKKLKNGEEMYTGLYAPTIKLCKSIIDSP